MKNKSCLRLKDYGFLFIYYEILTCLEQNFSWILFISEEMETTYLDVDVELATLKKVKLSVRCDKVWYSVFIEYCVFSNILKYSGLWPLSVLPRCQCVYTKQTGRTPALQQNWQSSEKSQYFEDKTQYLLNTLYFLN